MCSTCCSWSFESPDRIIEFIRLLVKWAEVNNHHFCGLNSTWNTTENSACQTLTQRQETEVKLWGNTKFTNSELPAATHRVWFKRFKTDLSLFSASRTKSWKSEESNRNRCWMFHVAPLRSLFIINDQTHPISVSGSSNQVSDSLIHRSSSCFYLVKEQKHWFPILTFGSEKPPNCEEIRRSFGSSVRRK